MTATVAPALAPPLQKRSRGSAAVCLDGLTKEFLVQRTWREMLRHPRGGSRTTAVSDVSFDIESGEFFGLLGPNGAGKTTIFKMLTGSSSPDGGTATVFGHDVYKDTAGIRQLVGCVMASERSLYWRLSAYENLRLFAALYKLHGRPANERIREVLKAVDLAGTGEKMVATFSSGMRQRLLIARALLPHPRLLLLDEPTRSLDPLSARSFRELLRRDIAGREGCTVMLATHSSEEALELCDRVAILDRGQLLALGTTDEIARRYGEQVFCLWTRSPDHPALVMLDVEARIKLISTASADEAGWHCVRLTIAGGADRSADVLACLVASGVDVARFEHVTLSLADLLDRVLQQRRSILP